MTTTWSQVRYWLAVSASLWLAVLIIPSGLAMGGPRGVVGWSVLALMVAAPIAIWWTRWGKIAAVVQYAYLGALSLAALAVAWATLST